MVKMKLGISFALILLNISASLCALNMCQLIWELQDQGVTKDLVKDWLCLVDTVSDNVYNKTTILSDGSTAHGMFQIVDTYWCTKGVKPGLDCNVTCDEVKSTNIEKAVACALKIYTRHGFDAWPSYRDTCLHQDESQFTSRIYRCGHGPVDRIRVPREKQSALQDLVLYTRRNKESELQDVLDEFRRQAKKAYIGPCRVFWRLITVTDFRWNAGFTERFMCVAQKVLFQYNYRRLDNRKTNTYYHGLFQVSDYDAVCYSHYIIETHCGISCSVMRSSDIDKQKDCLVRAYKRVPRYKKTVDTCTPRYDPSHCVAGNYKSISQCDLFWELKDYKFGAPMIKKLLCLANSNGFRYDQTQYENKRAVNFLHGLFGIGEVEWCHTPLRGPPRKCNVPCSSLRTRNLDPQVKCILTILNSRNSEALADIEKRCPGNNYKFDHVKCSRNTKNTISPCDVFFHLLEKYSSLDIIRTLLCLADTASYWQYDRLTIYLKEDKYLPEYGLFHIRETVWCPEGCDIDCKQLITKNLNLQTDCAEKIYHADYKGYEENYKQKCSSYYFNATQCSKNSPLKICDLFWHLYKEYIIESDNMLICLAELQSGLQSDHITSDQDFTLKVGLFQIHDKHWCTWIPSGTSGCDISCQELMKKDLDPQIACALKVLESTDKGFEAEVIDTCNSYKFNGTQCLPPTYHHVDNMCNVFWKLREITTTEKGKKLLCMAQRSNEQYDFMTFNEDYTISLGLFQIKDKYWCTWGEENSGCNVHCSDLLSSDVNLQMECALKVLESMDKGFGDEVLEKCDSFTFNATPCFPESFSRTDICDLFWKLRDKFNSIEENKKLLCLAQLSDVQYDFLSYNQDNTLNIGLFQINDSYCYWQYNKNSVCNVYCKSLYGYSVDTQIDCALLVYESGGYNANVVEKCDSYYFNATKCLPTKFNRIEICELYWKLRKDVASIELNKLLLCLAMNSSLQYSLLTSNEDNTLSLGLFQIKDIIWCSWTSEQKEAQCKINCYYLNSTDLRDQMQCAIHVYKSDGYSDEVVEQCKSLDFNATRCLPSRFHTIDICDVFWMVRDNLSTMKEVRNFLCLALNSSMNYDLIKSNEDFTLSIGLFQIKDFDWCGWHDTNNTGCDVMCDDLLQYDLRKQMECAKKVYLSSEHPTSTPQCTRTKIFEHTSHCVTSKKTHVISVCDLFLKLKEVLAPLSALDLMKMFFCLADLNQMRYDAMTYDPDSGYITLGLFQRREMDWCSWQANVSSVCNVTCHALLSNDLELQIKCALLWYQQISSGQLDETSPCIPPDDFEVDISYCLPARETTTGLFRKTKSGKIRGEYEEFNVVSECELYEDLKHFLESTMAGDLTDIFLCLANVLSLRQYDLITSLPNNHFAYGLYQVNDRDWCGRAKRGGLCNIACSALKTRNLFPQMMCAAKIYRSPLKGSAWPQHTRCAKETVKKFDASKCEIPKRGLVPQPMNLDVKLEKIPFCELLGALRANCFPRRLLPKWMCLVEHMSSFHYNAISQNSDGYISHGLFQINDKYWCTRSGPPGKECNVQCDDLRTRNITKAAECALLIFNKNLFNAWSQLPPICTQHYSLAECSTYPLQEILPKCRDIYVSRCVLAHELLKQGIPDNQLPDWVCLAEAESGLQVDLLTPNRDGSYSHGIFQLSGKFWCAENEHSENDCEVKCSELRSSKLKISIECAKLAYKRHGFTGWRSYEFNCVEKKPDLSACFV